MCLAIPLKIMSINHGIAIADLHGVLKEISLLLLPEEVEIGDYVLVHAGFAIQKIDEHAAEDVLDLMREIAAALDQESIPSSEAH
jgi:hydrogenase expression/formation protein HypC